MPTSGPTRRRHRYRVIEARRNLLRGIHVVDDIDTADKGDSGVDHRQLAMHPPQPVTAEGPAGQFRAVDQHFRTGVLQCLAEPPGEVGCAEAVNQNPHGDTPPGRPGQGIGDLATGDVVGEDVGFQVNFVLCPVDGGNQRGEIAAAVFQQLQAVVGDQGQGHSGRRAADSGAWSESLDQGSPWWTSHASTQKPRT